MELCPRCRCYLFTRALPCPFCAAPAVRRTGTALAAVFTPIVITACYGVVDKGYSTGVFPDSDEPADQDADGYDALLDCDDANAEINPGATEDCADEIDNDCDEKIDADDLDCAP